MKINELIGEFTIYMSNEERDVYDKLDDPTPIHSFTEREQNLIESLVRKSLVSKINHNNSTLIVRNG